MLGKPSYFHLVPQAAIGALHRYVLDGIPTGGCLRAALENDFVGFHHRAADEYTLAAKWIAGYLYDEIPMQARGSKKAVDAWIKAGAPRYGEGPQGGNKR